MFDKKQVYASDKQSLKELEFDLILEWLNQFTIGLTAKKRVDSLIPINDFNSIQRYLSETDELVNIRRRQLSFPPLDFEELLDEIKLLGIAQAVLSAEGFYRIVTASDLVNRILEFFEKHPNNFQSITAFFESCYHTKEIIIIISKVIDRNGLVKDDASKLLYEIRQKIKTLKNQINRNFDKELRKLRKENFLGETQEGFINDRRVLTVQSTHKRKVLGTIVGSSKTGSLTFIEPQVNTALNHELDWAIDDEVKEIRRILQALTKELAIFLPLIESYQAALTQLDFTNAKSKLAIEMDAVLPSIQSDKSFEWINAFHPILHKNNKLQLKETIPQKISLDEDHRMLVISGPNAGGKSITLKTVGLLQLMLQSGLLIPVHPNSTGCIFKRILSDIGDNQSIENELSTYSYRLQRMNKFLSTASKNTMFLLDEFGTGSDPDLGGALAEVFFEDLYHKNSFAVITTHYANIKLKASQLPQAINACMLFDVKTLQPLFHLAIGQPGSSFTFEVAQLNGINKVLINKAKESLGENKVRFDRLLSELQQEKNYLDQLITEHLSAQKSLEESTSYHDTLAEKLSEKLRVNQIQNEEINKSIILGKKFQIFLHKFNITSRKKGVNDQVLEELKQFIVMEKSKTVLKEKQIFESQKSKAKPTIKKIAHEAQLEKIKVGSTVKINSSNQNGIVDRIEGKEVLVLIGNLRIKVQLNKLLFIK